MDIKLCISVLSGCAQEATPCGPHIVHTLTQITDCIRSYTRSSDTQLLLADARKCQLLVRMAEEAISSYPFSDVPDHWRRLYMDATLLEAVICLSGQTELEEADLLDLVKRLDMANIVTAYFDKGRREIFFSVMDTLQSALSGNNDGDGEQRPTKKARRSATELAKSRPHKLLRNVKGIRRYALEDAPSMDDLPSISEPFIVSDGASHWLAISDDDHAWKRAAYLRKVAGWGRIVPVEIGSSYIAEGWSQKMMDFYQFLDEIGWDDSPPSTDDAKLYLAQHDLFQQFPALLADVIPPDYVFAAMNAPDYFPEYTPPNTDAGYTINAWMGPAGTYSPAHTDPYHNCYVQVVGRKHIWVAPPRCAEGMRAQKTESDDESANDEEQTQDDQGNAAMTHFMDNTATLDVFDEKQYDTDSVFSKTVAPFAMQAILAEGDLLYMPPKWWHSIRSLDRSFSVSMWF